MNIKKGFIVSIQILCLILLTGCFKNGNYAEKREAELIKSAKVTIVYAGPTEWMENSTDYLKGVRLALEEINSKGFLEGKELEIKIIDDQSSFIEGSRIAQEVAQDPNVLAVVGHADTNVSLPVSAIYDDAGIIMLLPIDSSTALTNQGFKRLFQMVPNDKQIASELAQLMNEESCKNVAVFYEDNEYGKSLANAFEKISKENNLYVIDRTTNYKNADEFTKTIEKWQAMNVDSVFISGDMPGVGEFINEAKRVNINVPMYGGGGLNVANFIEIVGEDSENVCMPDLFDPNDPRQALQLFISKYEKTHGEKPDSWAIQGYDSLRLLVHAIEETDSFLPSVIADYLHSMGDWEGTIDDFHFAENGEKSNYTLFDKRIINGEYTNVERINAEHTDVED